MPSVFDRLLLRTALLSFDLLLGMRVFDGRGDEADLEGAARLGVVTVLVDDAGEVAEAVFEGAVLENDTDWEGKASSRADVRLGTDVALVAEACLGDDNGLDGDAGREVGACLRAIARLEAEAGLGEEAGVFLEPETNVGVCAISGTAAGM